MSRRGDFIKITDLKTIEAGRYLFIKIETDEGITGIGEAGAWGYIEATIGALNKMKDYLIGKDPRQIEVHWNYLYRSLYFRGSVIMAAISAIDIALWDILGKSLNVPTYQLLGGMCRDKVRCYAPVFEAEPEKMAQGCLELKKKGFTAARLMITYINKNVNERLDLETYSGKINEKIEAVKACREAVGEDFDLILEVHRSMTPSQAIAFARGVERYHPMFIEDPIGPDNPDIMSEVARQISIPIATGERSINIQEFEVLLARSGAKYVRPDVCVVGGITAGKKIASIAEAHYVGIVPHNPLGPISTAACLQLDACIPNFGIQEFPSFNVDGSENSMIKTPLQVKDGHILIPRGPGIGIELVDDIETRFPPCHRDLPALIGYDGFMQDR